MGTVAILGICQASSRGAQIGEARDDEDRFMQLSALLISHRLNRLTGTRLMAAVGANEVPMKDHIRELLAIAAARKATKAEDFFSMALGPAKATALAIVSAWYLGVVDDVPGARVFANDRALMFGPTSDTMTIPTYATAGPNQWGSASGRLDFMPNF